ncbi:MAG TPA: DUF5655 domain-containing protein [Chryseolinea sp.]|nr:DUF5655 domain-containing protein [Chryseolinea sp.]
MKPYKPISESLEEFVAGKPAQSVALLHYFIEQFSRVGKVQAIPAKTMIGIATERKRIAYVTRVGRDFIHVVFPFTEPHEKNLCFEKIAQVPGDVKQYNHHLRLHRKEDLNNEVRGFMKLAYEEGR